MRARFAWILAFLAMGLPASAQTPVQAFGETIDVQAVNLEAVVTDSRGNRVKGLTAADFRLLVDGVEMPITYFSAIDEESRHVAGEVASEAGDAPAAEPSWQSRSILVFLDEMTMLKARRDLVLRSLSRQIEDLGPGDQMAVVAFTGAGLEVICEWTGDRERLASVLAGVRERRSDGIFLEAARRQEASDEVLMDLAGAQGIYDRNPAGNPHTEDATLPDSPLSEEELEEERFSTARWQTAPRVKATQLFSSLDKSVQVGEAAAGAMRGLPAPPGRKMLMLLTEGFQDPVFAQPVIQEAGRLGYSLYPVDVKGIDTAMATNDVQLMGPGDFATLTLTSELDRGIDSTMNAMAAATGGKASINSNRTLALERLVADSSSYYVVGFSPTWHGDDRRHRIKLTVRQRGLKVRTRDSYVDASRRTRLALEAEASLLLGRSREEQRLIVRLDETAPAGRGRKIPITLGVPVESLAFIPNDKGFRAETPFAMVVLDDQGERRKLEEAWLAVDVEQLPLEGTYARFRFSLDAGRRAERLVVTVHDALTGEALWGEALLTP